MRWALRRARAILSVNFGYMLEFRVELLFWMFATTLPLIMMGLWVLAVRRGDFPLSESQIARYFLAVFLVRQFSIVWVIYEFEYYVVKGQLSPFLLQPIDPAWRFLGAHLSEQAARAPLVATMVALFLFVYPAALWNAVAGHERLWLPTVQGVLAAVLATYAAFLTRFLLQYTLAMTAFWVEKPTALESLLAIPYLYLSGVVAPLELFPEAVRYWAMWTPFPYLIWFPATLLTGTNTMPFAPGMAILLGWIALFLIVNRLLWRAGLRRYSAMGA